MADDETKATRQRVKRNQSPNLVYREGRYRIARRWDNPKNLEIRASVGGRRYRIGVGTDLRQAKRRLETFIAEMESGYKPAADLGTDWQVVARAVTLRHRYAAKDRGIPFEIGDRLVYRLMQETGFRCAVSGVAFSRSKPNGNANVDPWAPSIDRIDNRQGYLPDNVRIVAIAANYAMNRWGFDMLLRLAKGVVRTAQTVAAEPGQDNCATGELSVKVVNS